MGSKRRERGHRITRSAVLILATTFLLTLFSQFLVPKVAAFPLISVQLSVSTKDVEPGAVMNCTVFFNNTGSNTSSVVWIDVSFPSGLVYLSDNSAAEGGFKMGDYNWTFNNVTISDHSFDISFLVSGNLQDGEAMMISVNLNYLDHLSNPMLPSSAFATVTARRPVLSITKSADTYPVSPGQTFNYTISFQNTGNRSAALVYVNDTLPWALAYISDSAASIGGTMVSWLNWSFANVVGVLSFNLTVQALGNLTDGLIVDNQLILFYRNFNMIWFPEETATNTTAVGMPIFTFTKIVDKSNATQGDALDYTISLSNIGLGSSKEAWINDTIPIGTTYLSSIPLCDSFVNNTCMWMLYDLDPGTYEFHLTVVINDTAPSGSTIENTAYLNYTDAIGNLMGNLSSNDTTLVRETYLTLILEDRSLTSTPYDSLGFDILIRNHSPQPALKAWLNVSFPQEIQYVSDNVTDIGGIRIGGNRWEFNNVIQGNHSFRIAIGIVSDTVDGTNLQVDISLDHTDVAGVGFPAITDRITITIEAPLFSPEIVPSEGSYKRTETPEIRIFLNNTGSAAASSVWVDLSVPSPIKHLNDTSASISGVRLEDFKFLISNLEPGAHEFAIHFDIGDVRETQNIEIWLYVNYTDSNGDLIGQTTERVSFKVTVVTSEKFPVLPVGLVFLIAFVASLAIAFSRETTKYSFLMLIVPLFSRLRRDEVLDHETRGMIRGYIIANPGDHFNSIKDALDLKNGTLAHHLNILEREQIVKSMKDGKFRRFFPIGMKVSDRAYPTKVEKLILDIIRENPGIAQKDIADQLGMSQSTVSYHTAKLKEARRLRTERHGMSVRHYVEDSRE